jgi:hypothetical protein
MIQRFSAQPSQRAGVRRLFFALAFGVALTALPTAARAQLQARSLARTQNPPSADDIRNAAVGTPMVQTKAIAQEFGADAQSAMNVFAGNSTGSLGGNVHGCAGSDGQLPGGSFGSASSTGSFGATLFLVSSTLPVGTLIDIEFQYKGRLNARFTTDADWDDVTLSADLFINVQAVGQSALGRGSYVYQSVRGGGIAETKTGLFGANDTVSRVITGVRVGDGISFSASMEIGAAAGAVLFAYNSGDIKAGVVWGAQLSNPNASLVYGPSNTPFPSLSNVSEPSLDAAIPPFQLPIGNSAAAPEPSALTLLLPALAVGRSLIRRRFALQNDGCGAPQSNV